MAIYYRVKQGDCISSISFEHGFFPDTIWEHPNNAELKAKRKDLNVLMPEDVVFVPDKRLKEVREPTNQVHKFVLKTTPVNLNLQILDKGEPVGNEPFVLDVDGQITEGKTDSEGKIRATISPNAERGKLVVGEDERQREYKLVLRAIDPLDQVIGVKKRLHNLGYAVGDLDEKLTEELKNAILVFESENELEKTGEINETMRAKLKEVYGC